MRKRGSSPLILSPRRSAALPARSRWCEMSTGEPDDVPEPELAEEPYRVVREVLDSPGRLPESIRGLCRRAARYAEMKRGALLADAPLALQLGANTFGAGVLSRSSKSEE